MSLCPCGSSTEYVFCCQLIHNDHRNAHSSEQLMRARYSAFVYQNIDFLYNTFHLKTRVLQNKLDIAIWAKQNKWMNLEIINSKVDKVEFKAYYVDPNGDLHIHHEVSTFKSSDGLWYYLDGTYPK